MKPVNRQELTRVSTMTTEIWEKIMCTPKDELDRWRLIECAENLARTVLMFCDMLVDDNNEIGDPEAYLLQKVACAHGMITGSPFSRNGDNKSD